MEVPYGSRIAIIGRNGSGKTSLLRLLRDTVKVPAGYVPQVIEDFENQNGRIHVFTGNYDDYIR